MKTQHMIAMTAAALLGLAAEQARATTVATTPVGFSQITIPGNGATSVVGINLIATPPFAGKPSEVGASTVTVTGVDLTTRLTAGRQYALLVTSGTNAGVNTLVTGWTASQLTVQDDLGTLLTANQDSFQLQELPTVLEIFGTGGQVLTGGAAGLADRATVVDPATGEILSLYYSTGGISGIGWRAVGKASVNYGNQAVYFTDGISVLKKSAGTVVQEGTGAVQINPVALPVTAGFGNFANIYPVGSNLGNSQFFVSGQAANSLTGGTAALADQISFDSDANGVPEIYFYSTGGIAGVGWRKVGGGSTAQTSIEIPSGFSINKRSGTVELRRLAP